MSEAEHTLPDPHAVRAFWDQSAMRKSEIVGTLWTSHWAVQERISALVSGSPNVDVYQHAIAVLERSGVRFPVDRIASLGCGTGDLERGLSQYAIAKQYVGFDLSEHSIALAREATRSEPHVFQYEAQDLNAPRLGDDRFDAIFAVMALHHVEQLEVLASAMHEALCPGGWLIVNEYVGPNRFQWSDRQLALINSVLDALPPSIKALPPAAGKDRVDRESIETMLRVDASEAVRSEDIMPILEQHFELIERRDYGGTILHMLLADIVKNFNDEEALAVLRQIFLVEDVAMAGGLVTSDFTFAIFRRAGT